MMASMAFTSLIPSPANAADASQLANGALCAPPDQKFGEERDTADPDKGIATYVGGDMYVGKKPSAGVDAEGNITLSSSNTPDGSTPPEPKASPSSTANWRHKYNNAGKNWRHTGDVWRYGLRLLIAAVAAEAPYDKIVTGRWWDWSVMNPIFGLLIALVVCALAV